MPPRHAYWTIIFGNQPTSFRTHTQEELLPTFRQIQAKHPDAVMMWFAHGRLWKSPEDAREARFRKQQEHRRPRPQWRDRPPREDRRPGPPRDARPPRAQPKDRWRNRPPTADGRPPTADRKPQTANRQPPTADRPAPPPASPKPRSGDGGKPRSGEGGRPPTARGRDWRPGGTHKDPRDRFKVPRDVKRARFKAKLHRDRFHPRPGPPKQREGGPVPPKRRSREGGKKEDEE